MRGQWRTGTAALVVVTVVLLVPQAATAATVSATCNGVACSSGWYRSDVTVAFKVVSTKAIASTSGCGTVVVSADTPGTTFVCSVTIAGGDVVSSPTVTVRRDTKPPTVSAAADRPPDANGWYNHPVHVVFSGVDEVSGVAWCTAAEYNGPDTGSANVSGTCTDYAGNTGSGSFTLKYDSTPPPAPVVTVATNDRYVVLRWAKAPDTAGVQIVRSPGKAGAASSIVFTGKATRFADRSVHNGVRYQYTVTAVDKAGNRASSTVDAVAATPLSAPAAGSVVHAPPVLLWTPVPRATYYNVQLYRGRQKILSAWPRHPRYALSRTWTFAGRTYRLSPGLYKWLVWPGQGPRTAGRYGPLLGQSTFTVR
jgi:hypothetical protein